jgi:ribosome-binding ATPase YchF (GTP1/OBG family)
VEVVVITRAPVQDVHNAIKTMNTLSLPYNIYSFINPESVGDSIANFHAALIENHYIKELKEYAEKEDAATVIISAKIESELSELKDDEKQEMLDDLGIIKSGLDKLIEISYKTLGLKTYFTGGLDEVKAWTFKAGMNAKQCAGIIHTDFEKGFIKAEVISYEDLIKHQTELKVKEAGKLRIEGKNYIMQDGDICLFRFNR